jgi:hypothetical protein
MLSVQGGPEVWVGTRQEAEAQGGTGANIEMTGY